MKYFDIAIIGGGPGGYTAALRAAESGKSVVLFEENLVGGTCLNAGCIPTKAALNMAKNYARAKTAAADGYVVSASDFRFDFAAANKKKDESVQKIRNNLTKYLIQSKITIIEKKAVLKTASIDGELYNNCHNNMPPHPYAPPTEGNCGEVGKLYNNCHNNEAGKELYNTSHINTEEDSELYNNCHNNGTGEELYNYIIIEADGELYNVSYIIIASGGKCARYAIDGIDLAYSSDKWTKEFCAAEDGGGVVIIGGGVVGLELAAFYNMTGAKITMIMMEERPLLTYEKDLSLTAQMILKRKGIVLKTSSVVKSVKKESENLYTVGFESGDESLCAFGNLVIDASGRRANVTDLGLDDAGVKYDKKGIFADENFMTNVKNIYVVGDAARGNIRLAHKAAFDGEQVVRHILKEDLEKGNRHSENKAFDGERVVRHILKGDLENGNQNSNEIFEGIYDNPIVPICIYTVPEIAAAGMTSEECSAAGAEFFTGKAMMGANGKAVACGEDSGFLKVVFAKIDEEKKALSGVKYIEGKRDKFRLVGAHIIAENASEIIGGLAQLIAFGAEKEDILNTPFPHPSISEAFIEAIHNAKEKM